ncbi:collagen-binding adhesin autotransporter EmaA [Aggregatibacter aphrophilus]|uniref:collagen-binding adhesin autotransporter EmaA n=1 Tax=Aggregatibacter aphrophilus TaxID=732 RepID=UPI0028EAB736|nr:collagen-binding adhesin autotransporter EmaA [Aggregatibacter aphrophilus]
MNKIFKVIWCKSSQTWVAVSELCKIKPISSATQTERKSSHTLFSQLTKFSTLSTLLLIPYSVNAYVAIGATNNSGYAVSTGANAIYFTDDGGTPPYNYMNPGSKSYDNKDAPNSGRKDLYYNGKATGIAIGNNTNALNKANASNGIAIGDYSRATGGLAMSLGSFSTADNNGAVAIGTASRASGVNSLSMMRQASATGDYSTAIGSVAWSAGQSSFALGASATAKGNQSIAIGSLEQKISPDGSGVPITKYNGLDNTQTNGDRSMALGTNAKTNGDDSFAIGYKSRTGEFNTVMDSYLGENVMSADSNKKANKAIAVGTNTLAQKESSIAFGYEANSLGVNAISIGANARAAHDNVVAIGQTATATASGSMAIGQGAQSTFKNSLALGTGTVVNNVDGGQSKFTAQNYDVENGVISIANVGKERRIINLAAGRNDTDAVNVAQLQYVNKNLAKSIGGDNYTGYSDADGHTYQAPVFNIKNAQYNNVKAAVEAAQTNYVSVNSSNKASDSNYDNKGAKAAGSIALGDTTSTGATATNSIAIGLNTSVTGSNTVAIGAGITATTSGSVVLGDSSSTEGSHPTASVNSATVNGHTYNGFAGAVKDAGHFVSVGSKGTERQIKNVAAGHVAADSTDAINGSQLFSVASRIEQGFGLEAEEGGSVNKKLGQNVKVVGANSNIKTSVSNGEVKINLNNTLDLGSSGSIKIGDTLLNNNGLAITNGPTITSAGINAGNKKITGVAEGTEDNDAVNFKQLKNVLGGAVSTEIVEKKAAQAGDENLADITVADGKNAGDMGAKYEVSVSKKAVQKAAQDAIKVSGTSPITVNKTTDNGVDDYAVSFNGTEAAKSIPLTYKANGNNDKTVILNKGLNFTDGTMTTASVANDGVVKYDVNLSTIKVENGKAAVAGTPVNGANGTDGKDGVATVKNVVDALNKAAWTVAASKSEGEVAGNASKEVKNGDTVTYDAGKNIKITQNDKKFSFATKDDVEFTSVTTGNTKLTTNGVEIANGPKLTQAGIDAGNKKITDVADGSITAGSKEAVNGGQLFTETAKAKTTVEKGDENIQITPETAADGHTNYKVALKPSLTVGPQANGHPIMINGNDGHITGLTNKDWTGTPTSGRAATEDQLSVIDKKFDNKVSLGGDNGSTTEKALSSTGGIKFNIKGGDSQKYVTTTASGDDITVDLTQTTKDKIDNAADKNLSNITNDGKKAITGLGTIVEAADNTITVTNETDNVTGQKTYKIKANIPQPEKTAMASGKNTVVDGDGSAANPFKVDLKDDLELGQKDAGGINGKDSSVKVNGKDGSSVAINGKDGSITLNGKDGANPVSLKTTQGPAGLNGTAPKDRLTVNNESVATLEDGLQFAGDNGTDEVINKKLNQKLEIVGGADKTKLSDNNIGVNANNGKLEVKLAKELNDLTSAQFKDGDNTTVINGNGMTITPKDPTKAVSVTDKGLNNGGNQIVNIDSGLKQADGSAVALKDASGDILKNAVNVGDLKESINNITDATKNGGFGLSDDNGTTAKANLGETVKVKGDGSVVTKVVTDNGKPTLQVGLAKDITIGDNTNPGTITVKGENGKDGVSINGKDGSIGLNGKDGANASITVAQGKAGVDGKDGESKTRITYEITNPDGSKTPEQVATLNDGMKFVGNDGKVVTRKLNDTLSITGGINNPTVLADNQQVSGNNVGVRYKDQGGLEVVMKERPEFSGVVVNGKDGKDASVTFAKDGKDGMSLAGSRDAEGKDAITIKGKDGKDGVSFKDDGRITNVADGVDDKDAVNKSQLDKGIAQATSRVNAGKNITVTPQKNADGSTTYTVETKDDVEFTSVKSGDTTMDNNGISITGGPSVTKDGINASDKKITGVKDGDISATSKDAVNGSQLHQTNQNVNNLTTTVNKGLNFQGDNQEVTVNRKLGDQLNIRGGANPKKLTQNNIGVVADKNGTMTVQMAKDVNLGPDGSLTVGNTTINNDGIAIKGGPSMTQSGINAGGKRISNVARGKTPNDAVNMSQLQEVGNAINNRIDNIDNRVNKMDKRRKAGTASALATAGLMQPHRDGQSALVAAVGQYQSETAVAVGYSRISDNGKYGVKVSFSTNSQGEVGGTAGAGYFW